MALLSPPTAFTARNFSKRSVRLINRRKQAVEDLAVKPVTQFPVEISNEDAFASFKNVRHVTIKKVISMTSEGGRGAHGR